MPKRVIAGLIVVSLALGSAGCARTPGGGVDCRGLGGGNTLAFVLGVPLAAALGCFSNTSGDPQSEAREREARAAAEVARAATEEAAEKGDTNAQYTLGKMYENGYYVRVDAAEAAKWYRKSADQGYGPSQLFLARLYEFGRGVEQDNVQADMWYTIAASAEKSSATDDAITWRDSIEKRMTPEQIAEARKRAQEWKPTMIEGQSSN